MYGSAEPAVHLERYSMNVIQERAQNQTMDFGLRPLGSADISQSVDVERDAFPTQFPPTSFRQELSNRRARYLVACKRYDPTARDDQFEESHSKIASRLPLGKFFRNTMSFLGKRQADIVGLLGVWYMAEEAHIVSIGVRREYRGRGIGELLLIGAIEQATSLKATKMALEVRASNSVARNLYHKYGFTDVNVRKAYYHDNKENAIVMISDEIRSQGFIERFQRLECEHSVRWGCSERLILA